MWDPKTLHQPLGRRSKLTPRHGNEAGNQNQADGFLMALEGELYEEKEGRRSWNLAGFPQVSPLTPQRSVVRMIHPLYQPTLPGSSVWKRGLSAAPLMLPQATTRRKPPQGQSLSG